MKLYYDLEAGDSIQEGDMMRRRATYEGVYKGWVVVQINHQPDLNIIDKKALYIYEYRRPIHPSSMMIACTIGNYVPNRRKITL